MVENDPNTRRRRRGYIRYAVATVTFAFLAIWVIGAGLFAENAGRTVIGDENYANYPISRTHCICAGLILLLISAVCAARGFVIYRRRQKEREDLAREEERRRQEARERLNQEVNRWPATKLVEEVKLEPHLPTSRREAASVFFELAHRVKDAIDLSIQERIPISKSRGTNVIDGRFTLPKEKQLSAVWRRHEREDKWKCFEVRVEGNLLGDGLAIIVKLSVGLHDKTDPTEYPRQASPVSLYKDDVSDQQQSYSQQNSSGPSGSTYSHGANQTGYFVNYVRQPASQDFQFWCAEHPDEYSLFQQVKMTVVDCITSYELNQSHQAPRELPPNV